MAQFNMMLEGNLKFKLNGTEHTNLLSRLTNQKPTARMTLQNGTTFLIGKIIAIWPDEDYVEPEVEAPVEAPVALTEIEEVAEPEDTIEQDRADAMKELMAKSSCKHENQSMFYQNISTKKGDSARYFPVCEFCGQRFRFVKADDLTDEQKESAQLWAE